MGCDGLSTTAVLALRPAAEKRPTPQGSLCLQLRVGTRAAEQISLIVVFFFLRIWNALTDNYGNVMPVDWKSSHTRTLHLLTLNLSEKGVSDSLLFDTSDDEELREQLDMHSIIVSCVNEEPLFTADQVLIGEGVYFLLPLTGHLLRELFFDLRHKPRIPVLNCRAFVISTPQMCLLIQLSSVKIQREHPSGELGLNSLSRMPSSLISHARFSMEGISNVIQNGLRHTFGNSGGEKQYLTTVIPYEKKHGPPSVEDLQILTKILCAMKEDSEKVPSLLTDYILKVLCPT
ncbi:fasciculation and elongation protein zeta-2 [Ailuropoda melanoleuca]|uniref:fasciculation and elongation protein zeta-2 n=1 Tax=Ailuropoda melanoleuca TaxID=9646 RepID=UPI0014948467|nr:fasciculation and elongation protein zeta-2 [Ailuropoda melanoleuca]